MLDCNKVTLERTAQALNQLRTQRHIRRSIREKPVYMENSRDAFKSYSSEQILSAITNVMIL